MDTKKPEPAAPAEVHAFALTLEEFCQGHSKVERSVELLNAFFALETHAGRTQASESEFRARLAAFAQRPV